MEREELLAYLQKGEKRPGVDYVVVDLRKNDYEVLCPVTHDLREKYLWGTGELSKGS